MLFLGAAMAVAQSTPTADEAMLMKADSDFAKATQERRLDGWMEYMADDVILRRDVNVVGREAVKAALAPQWSRPGFTLNWYPVVAHMAAGRELGYTWGKWTRDFTDKEGKPQHLTGDYITLWAKQKEGSWKVIWDGGGVDPVKP
jgi:ketosteroid isomerase-like protein